MRLSDHTKGRPREWSGPPGPRRTAEIIRLDDYRIRRQPQMRRRRTVVVLQPVAPAPRLRHRIPVEVMLIVLILVSAAAGAVFALMGLGDLP